MGKGREKWSKGIPSMCYMLCHLLEEKKEVHGENRTKLEEQ
jgi:hypothetical protein